MSEGGHGDTLDSVGRVDTCTRKLKLLDSRSRISTSQHATALGADEAPDGHVDVGWTSLITVKTFLVRRVLGLNISDGDAELVVLLHLPDGRDLGHLDY